jgi:hypothetical protein
MRVFLANGLVALDSIPESGRRNESKAKADVAFTRRAMLKPPRAWWSRPYGDCAVTRNKKAGSDYPCRQGTGHKRTLAARIAVTGD